MQVPQQVRDATKIPADRSEGLSPRGATGLSLREKPAKTEGGDGGGGGGGVFHPNAACAGVRNMRTV